ncbi:MAG TPA: NOL1/NOP2/sun family putative RNA methylase [Clostridiaceae bacterium]|nr:NOL1/NOP2/sun family putative RNA methylase [Clostridiaceae bacterium]
MNIKLPEEFLNKMQRLLGKDEYEAFLASFDMPRYYGLRVNTLKISVEEFEKISPFNVERIPWTRDGFYYNKEDSPGKHPFYHAGLYYIQEPSAMLPATVLDAKPGERVLDLCAAPGGKTTQIAASMKGKGLLIANDVSFERLKALLKNLELCGVRNAIVTNEKPKRLSEKFKGFFDKILVDAPCSGEGMFRKDESTIRSWGKYTCKACASTQRNILEYADVMLKPGGRLVYSTCTFSPEENEGVIGSFLKKHKNYEVEEIPLTSGMENGRPEWLDYCWKCRYKEREEADSEQEQEIEGLETEELEMEEQEWKELQSGEQAGGESIRQENITRDGESEERERNRIKAALKNTARLWPHKVKGEGHFVAVLKKGYNASDYNNYIYKHKEYGNLTNLKREHYVLLESFLKEHFRAETVAAILDGDLMLSERSLYYFPEKLPDLSGIKTVKVGWHVGNFPKGRFEPSHSLIIALNKDDVNEVIDFPSDSDEIIRYLKGETVVTDKIKDIPKGYIAICVDGYTVGWGKQAGGMLKNLYPKGWRIIKD